MLIRGGTLVDAAGQRPGELRVGTDGRIAEVGAELAPLPDEQIVDARDRLVVPGGIDVHTHMHLPVGAVRVSDDFATGTRAAAVGGTTTVVDYVTAYRGEDPLAALATWTRWAQPSTIDWGLHMTFTEAVSEDTVAACVEAGVTSFKLYMAYPSLLQVDDGVIVDIMRMASRHGGLVTVHCENGGAVEAGRSGGFTPPGDAGDEEVHGGDRDDGQQQGAEHLHEARVASEERRVGEAESGPHDPHRDHGQDRRRRGPEVLRRQRREVEVDEVRRHRREDDDGECRRRQPRREDHGGRVVAAAPAPGGPFTMGSWRQSDWGPVLEGVPGWLGARLVGEPQPAGWSLLVRAVVEHVEIGGLVLDAGGAAHQHERPYHVGHLGGHVQRHAGAHGVAEVDGVATDLGHEPPRGRQVGGDAGRAAVAGRVDADHLVRPGQRRRQRSPAPAGLAEPVQQHDPGSRAVAFAVQRHGERFLSLT